ncbi:hypothetical protein E2C01_055988 [Portunus trituberculatus]|uniref:Uncharacterized protein n=1 Tax=Portunus trituberculatus TaxID=210409 RepID=A0A5B7GP60_PORTR|nr:hypothetical protein [Portunus trituberculatus]
MDIQLEPAMLRVTLPHNDHQSCRTATAQILQAERAAVTAASMPVSCCREAPGCRAEQWRAPCQDLILGAVLATAFIFIITLLTQQHFVSPYFLQHA